MTEETWAQIDGIPGWLTRNEATLLYDSVARISSLTGRVVEIGSFVGRSTACLALGLLAAPEPQSRLLAIDPHRGSPEQQAGQPFFDHRFVHPVTGVVDTYPFLVHNLTGLGLRGGVEVWRRSSSEALALFHEQARLVFIDGDHHPASVWFDCLFWSDKLCPSGLLLVHDYKDWEGPTKAVDRMLHSGRVVIAAQADSLIALRKLVA